MLYGLNVHMVVTAPLCGPHVVLSMAVPEPLYSLIAVIKPLYSPNVALFTAVPEPL